MYFETGQGSEFTYGKHNGIDMTTTEALCYGLARRYDPFMVNNVTGFIGPETHADNFEMIVANLQDHFMGKLLGLPMGMAPCYTLHSAITLDGQQMATELLTAAGANYYMDVCLNTDRMLAYFDTSGHDNQTLREVHGLRPGPEFLAWAIRAWHLPGRGATAACGVGRRWGDAGQFCASDAELKLLLDATPSAYGFATAGPRPADDVSRQVRLHQAVGREAIDIRAAISSSSPASPAFGRLSTEAADKQTHLNSPSAGGRVCRASARETHAGRLRRADSHLRRSERGGHSPQPGRCFADHSRRAVTAGFSRRSTAGGSLRAGETGRARGRVCSPRGWLSC